MAQLFIAQALASLLQLWEDQNIVGELNFQSSQFFKNKGTNFDDKDRQVLPRIGSELNPMGTLARGIPNFQHLRKLVEGVTVPAHPTGFLPRVPKEYKGRTTPEQLAAHRAIKGSVNIPTFLSKWTETRRVCIVEDSVPIPRIDLREENWLSFIPYPSLYLRVASPFIIPATFEHDEMTIQDFLIFDEGNDVRILFWQKEAEQALLTEDERNGSIRATEEFKANRPSKNLHLLFDLYAKPNAVAMCPIIISKDAPIIRQTETQNFIWTEDLLYEPAAPGDETDQEIHRWIVTIVEMINGFCKLTAELPPASATTVNESASKTIDLSPPRQWFELPVQTVQYFQTDTVNNKIVITRGSGSEVSPHYRRGHYRRIIQKDGTERKVWIADVIVREDKLEQQLIQGGALKIK